MVKCDSESDGDAPKGPDVIIEHPNDGDDPDGRAKGRSRGGGGDRGVSRGRGRGGKAPIKKKPSSSKARK